VASYTLLLLVAAALALGTAAVVTRAAVRDSAGS
jgi:hypothetical protein